MWNKKDISYVVSIVLIFAMCVGMYVRNEIVWNGIGETVGVLQGGLNAYIQASKISELRFKTQLLEIFKTMIGNDELMFQKIEDMQGQLDEITKDKLPIDLDKCEDILSANMVLRNPLRGAKGSGTHIRLRNQDYILTCGHLIRNTEEPLWAYDKDDVGYALKLVKYNGLLDLALYKIMGTCPKVAALEISDIEPKRGSAVTVVGNPDGYDDIITEGVLTQSDDVHYSITNTIWYGNSGGALLYRGKIIGVIVQLDCKMQGPIFVMYGKAVKLEHIKRLIKEYE